MFKSANLIFFPSVKEFWIDLIQKYSTEHLHLHLGMITFRYDCIFLEEKTVKYEIADQRCCKEDQILALT